MTLKRVDFQCPLFVSKELNCTRYLTLVQPHDVVSPQAVRKLFLKPEKTSKVVTVATGYKSAETGKPSNVPLLFDNLQAKVYCSVLKNILLDTIIKRLTLKGSGRMLT